VSDYQYEFRDFVFGSKTSFTTETVEGFLGLPDIRSNDQDRQDDHGFHAGVDLLSGRRIIFEIIINGTPGVDTEQKLRQVNTAFQSSKNSGIVEYPLYAQRPGRAKVFVRCRARRCSFLSSYEVAHGLARGAVELFGSDPRIYEDVLRTASMTITQGNTSGPGVIIDMKGDFLDGTQPIIEISGPCINPRVTNTSDNNRAIRMDVVLSSTDLLVVDTKLKTVFINGVDRYDIVRSDNQWWSLLPGINNLLYTRSSNSGVSTATVKFRYAYTTA
jgi:hypothetical protein